jgi:predicted ATPase
MVGRDEQLAQLRAALDAVRAGRGRAALLVGEPGIGKSRLLAEIRKIADQGEGVTWIEGRCLSFGQALPYHLLVDVGRSLIGVPGYAEEPETRAALRALLGRTLGDEGGEPYALLGHLLAIRLEPAAQAIVEPLEAQTLVGGYLKWLSRILGVLARDRPVVLVCEDIHWADASSAEAIAKLLTLVRDQPILLICTTRPDRDTPGWRLVGQLRDLFGEAMLEITLRPLTQADSRELVANLLVIESLPTHVRDFILARAEGNPFFVEEVIRMLIDRGAIVRQGGEWVATSRVEGIEIPDTLQGLLLARIDRLPEDAKRTLRVASVIGRQFSVRVLESVLEESRTQ